MFCQIELTTQSRRFEKIERQQLLQGRHDIEAIGAIKLHMAFERDVVNAVVQVGALRPANSGIGARRTKYRAVELRIERIDLKPVDPLVFADAPACRPDDMPFLGQESLGDRAADRAIRTEKKNALGFGTLLRSVYFVGH